MTLTYLLFVHNNPAQVYRLVKRLNAPKVDFFIHVDAKAKEDFNNLLCFPNVNFSSKRFSIEWGGITMVEALLFCCQELLEKNRGEMVCFLSGQDYPVKSNEYIQSYLQKYPTCNFVTGNYIPSPNCSWLEHGRRRIKCYALRLGAKSIATVEPRCFNWNNFRQLFKVLKYRPGCLLKAISVLLFWSRRIHPAYLLPVGGEFWWVLPVLSLEKVIAYVKIHPDFTAWHKYTSSPDELFFPTLVYNLFPISSIINSCLRYIKWKSDKSPEDILLEDEEIIMRCIENPDFLFVRKVSDLKVCDYLDSKIID